MSHVYFGVVLKHGIPGFQVSRFPAFRLLGQPFILRVFQDTWGHNDFVSFFAGLKDFSRKKSQHVSRPTIGYLWAKYNEF